MSQDAYELLALAMRYVFIVLMAAIVLRAALITLKDSRRANFLRRWSPETGLAGEIVVLSGGGRAPDGMRYPVIREGMLGSGKKADIRIRHQSVWRRHGYFTLEKGGLRIRADRHAPVFYEGVRVRDALLPDGARFTVGKVKLLLVLTTGDGYRPREDNWGEDIIFYNDNPEPYTEAGDGEEELFQTRDGEW